MDANDNGVFELGEIVDARADGFRWGTKELVAPFKVVRVPDRLIPGATIEQKRANILLPLKSLSRSGTRVTDTADIKDRKWLIRDDKLIEREATPAHTAREQVRVEGLGATRVRR